MFLRAINNRINRVITFGRRVSSSSIPIQNPDSKPGPVGLDYLKATFKWENFTIFVGVIALVGDFVYLNLQGKENSTALKDLRAVVDDSVKDLRAVVDDSNKENRELMKSSAKENRSLLESSNKENRSLLESSNKETRDNFHNLLVSLNSSSQNRPYGGDFPPIGTPPSRPPTPPRTPID